MLQGHETSPLPPFQGKANDWFKSNLTHRAPSRWWSPQEAWLLLALLCVLPWIPLASASAVGVCCMTEVEGEPYIVSDSFCYHSPGCEIPAEPDECVSYAECKDISCVKQCSTDIIGCGIYGAGYGEVACSTNQNCGGYQDCVLKWRQPYPWESCPTDTVHCVTWCPNSWSQDILPTSEPCNIATGCCP